MFLEITSFFHIKSGLCLAGLDAESLSVYLRIFFRKMGNDTDSLKCLSSFED